MAKDRSEPERIAVGFLSVLRFEEQGYLGGYLIVDRHGHPLSFHCTEPVQPNRVQQILYGTRLEPYLLGRRIGAVLIEKGRPRPALVLTDHRSVLAAAQVVELPIAWLALPGQGPADAPPSPPENPGREPPPSPRSFGDKPPSSPESPGNGPPPSAESFGGSEPWLEHRRWRLLPAAPETTGRRQIAEVLQQLDPTLELDEPFERIRLALEEARRAA